MIDLEKCDLSYIEDVPAEKQQFYWVGLFYFLANAAITMKGEEGERSMRKAIRAYGIERGQRMRKIADSKGLEANLLTLFDNYDLMSDPRFVHPQEGRVVTAEVKKSITGRCPDAEMWGRLPDGLAIGSIYCEEVHHKIYGGFDPAIQVNLCETLTNGGNQCRFHIYCRKCNQTEYLLAPYVRQDWEDFEGDMVASIHSIFCIMYIKMARILKDELGEEVVRSALTDFAWYRGVRMRRLHEEKGLPISVKSFIKEGDLFLDHRFALSCKEISDHQIEVETKRNILYEVASSYDSEDLFSLYEEVTYPALLNGYGKDFSCRDLGSEKEHTHLLFSQE